MERQQCVRLLVRAAQLHLHLAVALGEVQRENDAGDAAPRQRADPDVYPIAVTRARALKIAIV
jgi:hypothetical protein